MGYSLSNRILSFKNGWGFFPEYHNTEVLGHLWIHTFKNRIKFDQSNLDSIYKVLRQQVFEIEQLRKEIIELRILSEKKEV